jgi:hypothetical protein
VNPEPISEIVVPPVVGPVFQVTPLMIATVAATYENRSALLVTLVPLGVVTVTSTVVPAVPGGVVTFKWLSSDTTITFAASAVVPKRTVLAMLNPVPIMVAWSPPAAVP